MPNVPLEYRSSADRRFDWRDFRRLLYLTGPLVAVELACAQLAYHTIGEIVSGMLFALVLFGNLVVIAAAFANTPAARVVLLLLALLVVPYQLVLGVRWWRVHREAERVVAFAEAGFAATGQYPPNLSGYVARDRGTLEYIRYGVNGVGTGGRPYDVAYSVGTETTSRWWEPGAGWRYYPD
jgi:hypothetical protein